VLTGKGEKTLAKGDLPEGTQIHADLLAFANALLENKA
jgi:D-glycero-D-manno-heptose 1,7-bisphosphate phosphatase